ADLAKDYLDIPEDLRNPDLFYKEGIALFGMLMLFVLVNTFFLFLTRQTIIVMSRLIEYDLKNEIYDKYQALSYSFYKVNSTGDIMNRISEDVTHVRMYLGPAVMYSLNVVVLCSLTLYQMIDMSPMLTLYVLLPLPVMSVLIFKISQLINKKSTRVQKQQSSLSTFVQETFSGIRVLKAFGKEDHFVGEFEDQNVEYRKSALSLAKTNAFFSPVILLLIGLSTIITIYAGGLQVIAGTLDIGDIIAFIIYVNMLTWPFAAIGWVSSLVQRAAASQERINEFLKVEKEIKESDEPVEELIKSIEFKDVSFTYPNTGVEALKNINFKIEHGKTLAITGRTGSGKSTIAILMERLFDVENGSILINGINIKEFKIEPLRSQIGYVPQEVFLFSDTIENNISFGLDNDVADTEMIEQAAKDAHIHHNIVEFELEYKTKVGERGITLSGGQKQRVSIARAIIRNPELLIFDDCLSAVDTETEEVILNNLNRIMKGKTNIIIGHRISSIKQADTIIVLDEGRVTESGSHEELIYLNGVYAEMYRMQLVEEK
ncbi:MAG: ATP-binding cassette subfamily B multidrug efflux pump, partial [Flavobacteriales bacterium]